MDSMEFITQSPTPLPQSDSPPTIDEPFTHIGRPKDLNEFGLPEPEEDVVDMTITKELRQATKEVHKLSDVLVNAKFALALSDDTVWYDGLLAFHEIYKFFEANLPADLLPPELHRAEAFEKDIEYFFGPNWKRDYKPRPSVVKYLKHLEKVTEKNRLLLFAYAFQMYMAIMSGGQLLQKKRMIKRKLWNRSESDEAVETSASTSAGDPDDLQSRPMPVQVDICPNGCAATFFPMRIPKLKNKLRRILNRHYAAFDEEMRAEFIKESQNVFRLNCEVVRSIRGVTSANMKTLAWAILLTFGIYFAIKLAKHV